MEAPLSVGSSRKPAPGGPDRSREQCFSTTLDIGGQFAASNSDSVAVLGAGATANLVRFKWLDNRIIFLQRQDFPKVMPYSTSARFKFGGGRATEVKHAADIKVGIAWGEGAFAGFVLDADIPALLRKGVLGSLGGQLDFERDILSIRTHGVNVPLNVNEMGRYVLSAVEFGKGPPYWARVPVWAASYSEWPISEKRPDLSVGGLRLPLGESGLLRFVPPKEFSTCAAATSGDARGDSISDPKQIIMKSGVNWGHASASQLKRALVDSDGGNSHLVNFAGDVLDQCDVCRASDQAPHIPIADTSVASMFNERCRSTSRFWMILLP